MTVEQMDRSELIESFTSQRYVLQGYILAIVRDYHIAEDVYQDVAVAVLENLDRFRPGGNFQGWVRGIARNKAKQALTQRHRVESVPNDRLEELIDTAYEQQSEEKGNLLSRYHVYLADCLSRLTVAVQDMVRLHYIESESMNSVGLRVGKSSGAVQVSLSRARELLHSCIEKRFHADVAAESEP